jgi:hypothetical protein
VLHDFRNRLLVNLARALADPAVCQFDDALRYINDAITASEAGGEKWCEPEVYRVAGEATFEVAASRRNKKGGSPFRACAHCCRLLATFLVRSVELWECVPI